MIAISPGDLAIAVSLVAVDGALSVALRLGFHRELLVSVCRMVVQLVLVGYALRWVFALDTPGATVAVVLLMIFAASREVVARPKRKLSLPRRWLTGGGVVSVVSALTVVLALTTAVRPDPWYAPQYVIPFMGIVLGSVLNSASIAIDAVLRDAHAFAARIDAHLALGATRVQAFRPYVVSAIRSGMLPVINQMSAAGIITLPGIMTGQVLAGVDALDAARYQILLMLILAGASGLSAVGGAALAASQLTDARHRLRRDRIVN